MKIFNKFTFLSINYPKTILFISSILVVVACFGSYLLIPKLSSGGYDDPNSDSAKVATVLKDKFNTKNPWVVLVVEPIKFDIDSKIISSDVQKIEDEVLKIEGVEKINSYWKTGLPQFKSKNSNYAYFFIYLKPDKFEEANEITKIIEKNLEKKKAEFPNIKIHFSGTGPVMNAINNRITKDVAFAEIITVPISLFFMMIVFGTLVAALTPLLVALFAITCSLALLWVISFHTNLSIFSLNLITALGLGLGIDYSLLIVSRFREELIHNHNVETSIKNTVSSAGKTVFFSGLTVAFTLASMSLFPQYLLKSFAWAGVLVVTLAVVGALFILPSILKLLGEKINSIQIRKINLVTSDEGAWWHTALFVMQHPLFIIFSTLIILIVFASPIKNIKFGQLDERVLPKNESIIATSKIISENFIGKESTPIEIIMNGVDFEKDSKKINEYAKVISQKKGILRLITHDSIYVNGVVVAPNIYNAEFINKDNIRFNVVADVVATSNNGQVLIRELRKLDKPVPQTFIGGKAAEYEDSQMGVVKKLKEVCIWIIVTTFIVIFLFTGSVILPIKAVILNIQSLGATFGALTWIFLEGNLKMLIGDFNVTGNLDTTSMVLIFILVYGLSMDYELFLLSRIKEERDFGANTTSSVALGLQRSGRIITAAALLLAIAFAGTITSGVMSVKLIGVGVVLAILLDATIVRALLVPALMKVAGSWNWWSPAPLKYIHSKFGIKV